MKNKKANSGEQRYSFALKKIQLLEKSLGIITKRESEDKYDFDVSLKINLNDENQICINMFSVKVKLKTEKNVLASISILCVFDIFNYDQIVLKTSPTPELPNALLNLLNTVVIGTMRGVMFSEFRGTALDNVVLPVLDPSKFERTNS